LFVVEHREFIETKMSASFLMQYRPSISSVGFLYRTFLIIIAGRPQSRRATHRIQLALAVGGCARDSAGEKMEYFELPEARPGQDGLCSDNDCPCGYPGAIIPRGSGYMYISKDVVEFRRDARSVREAERKKARWQQQSGVLPFQNLFTSTLMCEQGARKRGLDLDVAAADAKYWWETGLVPLRATPLAGSKEAKEERERLKSREQSSPKKRPAAPMAKKRWWEFGK
jgi:hypothetical protein